VRTRRGPSAVARFGVVATAALACAAGPGVARADGSELAGLADQIQAATWSGVSGTVAAQPSTQDLAQKITDATRAAVAGAVAEASPTTLIAGRGDSPKEAQRAAANQIPRARVHQKARPRPAAAAASPLHDAEPASPAEPEVRHIATPDRRERERERKPPETPGAARAPHGPSLPFDLPSIPVPFAVPSSAGAASGGGSPVPPLLVALVAVIGFFVREVVSRRAPPRQRPYHAGGPVSGERERPITNRSPQARQRECASCINTQHGGARP